MRTLQGSELGEGSFATVEECVLRGQRVAVKRLRAELVTNLDEVECFLAEGMTLSKLHHPCGPFCTLLCGRRTGLLLPHRNRGDAHVRQAAQVMPKVLSELKRRDSSWR